MENEARKGDVSGAKKELPRECIVEYMYTYTHIHYSLLSKLFFNNNHLTITKTDHIIGLQGNLTKFKL